MNLPYFTGMRFNRRFEIDSDRNLVTDLQLNLETKLEPRVMKVLQYLLSKKNELVTREELIERIWDNYGGAEDALTQAISVLRKTLNDAEKELIRTVPKKGYILEETAMTDERFVTEQPAQKQNPRLYWVTGLVIVAMLTGIIYSKMRSHSSGYDSAEPQADSQTIRREREQNQYYGSERDTVSPAR